MFVTYTGGDRPQVWRFLPGDVRISEARDVEAAMGRGASWDDFTLGIKSGAAHARVVLLWHLMRREHPSLAISDLPDFRIGDLKVEFDSVELAELRDQVAASYLPEDKKAAHLASIDEQIAEAIVREESEASAELAPESEAEPPGKAPAVAGPPDPVPSEN